MSGVQISLLIALFAGVAHADPKADVAAALQGYDKMPQDVRYVTAGGMDAEGFAVDALVTKMFPAPESTSAVTTGAAGKVGWAIAKLKNRGTGHATVALLDGKIVWFAVSRDVPDARLAAGRTSELKYAQAEKPSLHGDDPSVKAIDQLVVDWIEKGGLAAAAAPGALACGTSSSDFAATSAEVGKLVKAWDGLHMLATSMNVDVLGKGALAIAHGDVLLPLKNKKGYGAELAMTAILVPDGKSWKWAALDFFVPLDR